MPAWPASVSFGRGMVTSERANSANMKLMMSIVRIPAIPIGAMSAPARIGEITKEAFSTNDIMPLARVYCFFGNMVLTAAE